RQDRAAGVRTALTGSRRAQHVVEVIQHRAPRFFFHPRQRDLLFNGALVGAFVKDLSPLVPLSEQANPGG
ncbi:MAG: hypothetical protein WA463_08935, partial [Terriglobales bacterium]